MMGDLIGEASLCGDIIIDGYVREDVPIAVGEKKLVGFSLESNAADSNVKRYCELSGFVKGSSSSLDTLPVSPSSRYTTRAPESVSRSVFRYLFRTMIQFNKIESGKLATQVTRAGMELE